MSIPTARRLWMLIALLSLGSIPLCAATSVHEAIGVTGLAWPNWRGPYCNGTALPAERPLIENLNGAKQLWQSEAEIPTSYEKGRPGGGFADPIIAYGKVYQYYTQPSAEGPYCKDYIENQDPKYVKRRTKMNEAWVLQAARIPADDFLVCMDAATGKTLWTAHFPQEGINWSSLRDGGSHFPRLHNTPCAAYGRVYMIGAKGMVSALDAESGERLWGPVPVPGSDRLEAAQQRFEAGEAKAYWEPLGGNPVAASLMVADGVVATNDWRMEPKSKAPSERSQNVSGVVGFDADTGEQLWHYEGCLGKYGTPVRWVHAGEEYFVAAGPERAIAIEPKTGRILWEIVEPSVQHAMLAKGGVGIDEHHLITVRGYDIQLKGATAPASHADKAMTHCWRIAPDGANLAWTLPAKMGWSWNCGQVVCDGRVYLPYKESAQGGLCVDLATGEVIYTSKDAFHDVFDYAPLISNGRLLPFNAQVDGPEPVKHDGKFPGMGAYLSPAMVAGLLYVRDGRGVSCYDLRQ